MRKYLFGFKLYFLNSFNFRFNAVINLIFGGLSLLIIIFFWHLIYDGDTQKVLNGFTLAGITTYFLLGRIFSPNFYPGPAFSGMIKSGKLGPALLKPRSLCLDVYFRNIANMFTGMIPQALFMVFLLPFVGAFLTWDVNAFNSISMVIFFVVGTVSNFLIFSLMGYLAFWFEEAESVFWLFVVITNVLTGWFIPLAFFPSWSVPILEMLPFASWSYIPITIFLGLYDADRLVFLLIVHLLWVAILLVVNRFVWQKGIMRFTSVGG